MNNINQNIWHASVLTLFPQMFPGPLAHSLAGKGLEKNIWQFEAINIRDFANNKHSSVDDICFGGGAGMVLRPEVVNAALSNTLKNYQTPPAIVYLTPRGKPLEQQMAAQFARSSGLIALCGRYEGVDDRVIEHWRDNHDLQEVSIGDYILSGGESAAIVLIDACVRLLDGIVHDADSLIFESFSDCLLEHPHYTKPRLWNGIEVPSVLLSGDHKKINQWRLQQMIKITKQRRPDLWFKYMSYS